MVIKGTTSTGFEYEIETEALNDMEVVDSLVDMMDSDEDEIKAMKSIKKLIDKVLGAKQKKALYDHVNTNGRIPIEKVNAEFLEILSSTKSGKN